MQMMIVCLNSSPVSKYYECVRLPLHHQLSSLLLVELTGKKTISGVYGLSLVPDNTLFTCHAQSPRRSQETSLYHC